MPEEEQPKKYQWINRSGTFRMRSGRIIKPNQKFEARVDEIPNSFRDVIEPLENLPGEETGPEPVPDTAFPDYQVVSRGKGWFDVIDATGKKVNEKSLRQQAADDLRKALVE